MAENFSKSDKDYGLPKVELKPIDRGQPGVARVSEKPAKKNNPENNKNRIIPWLIVLGFILLIGGLAYYFFWGSNPPEISNQQTVEEPLNQGTGDQDVGTSSEEIADNESGDSNADDQEPDIQDEPGSIVTISQRTGRYYIFLGSYKFRAYARRHADKLAKDGFAVKLITPDNWVGVRVAVGNYSSEDEASGDAEMIKNKYGNEVVVSKY